MWMQLCVESESYLGFGKRLGVRKKCCEAKKDAKRVVYMAMNQKAREAVEVNSCRHGRELFRIAKQRLGEKKDVVGVSCVKVFVHLTTCLRTRSCTSHLVHLK